MYMLIQVLATCIARHSQAPVAVLQLENGIAEQASAPWSSQRQSAPIMMQAKNIIIIFSVTYSKCYRMAEIKNIHNNIN